MSALTFDAVSESAPGPKWQARWNRSWPAYEAWFLSRGGDTGPDRQACEAALRRHMPELVPIHARLTQLAGGSDRAARFLSTWCPPAYLGGCSIAAGARGDAVRLVRNYDLSPDLNEGLLLRSDWCRPVMGMVEFLWGLSDGINDAGLSVALAYGGRREAAEGFGITTILRYIMETCEDTGQALAVLERVPSHMAYNVVLADRHGRLASVEVLPGGGTRRMPHAIATNHQHGSETVDSLGSGTTWKRHAHLAEISAQGVEPEALADAFLSEPLFQRGYQQGFGTLFTADYDPGALGLTLSWQDEIWHQTLTDFEEGSRTIVYEQVAADDWIKWIPVAFRSYCEPGATEAARAA